MSEPSWDQVEAAWPSVAPFERQVAMVRLHREDGTFTIDSWGVDEDLWRQLRFALAAHGTPAASAIRPYGDDSGTTILLAEGVES